MPKTNEIPQLQESHYSDMSRYDGLTEIVQKFEPKLVLDFGCSKAAVLRSLVPNIPTTTFVGVETSKEWRDRAWKGLRKYDNAEVLSSLNGLSPGQFDMVLALSVLMDNSEDGPMKEDVFYDALDVLVGLLKPGGILVCWNNDWDPDKHDALFVVPEHYDTYGWKPKGKYKGKANVYMKKNE